MARDISRTNGATWEFFQNVESVLEGTFVEPGPIRSSRPEGMVYGAPEPAPADQPTKRTGRFAGCARFDIIAAKSSSPAGVWKPV